jgi:hypothetical protein
MVAQLRKSVRFERADPLRGMFLVLSSWFEFFMKLSSSFLERERRCDDGGGFEFPIALINEVHAMVDDLAHSQWRQNDCLSRENHGSRGRARSRESSAIGRV